MSVHSVKQEFEALLGFKTNRKMETINRFKAIWNERKEHLERVKLIKQFKKSKNPEF